MTGLLDAVNRALSPGIAIALAVLPFVVTVLTLVTRMLNDSREPFVRIVKEVFVQLSRDVAEVFVSTFRLLALTVKAFIELFTGSRVAREGMFRPSPRCTFSP